MWSDDRIRAQSTAHTCRLYAHRRELAATANALTLAKCLRQKMWPDSQQQCRQLGSVSRSVAKAFAGKGVRFIRSAIQLYRPRRPDSQKLSSSFS